MLFRLSKLLVASRSFSTIPSKSPKKCSSPPFFHNGQLDYQVRIAKQNDTPKIFNFLEKNFLQEDPLVKSLKVETLHPFLKKIYEENIRLGFSLLATKGEDREILGVAINSKSSTWDGKKLEQIAREVESCEVKTLLNIYGLLSKAPNLNCRLSQFQIFEIGTLSIAIAHQGKGIGAQLVKRSLGLARDMGYEWARMNCSCVGRKNVALQAGMQKIIEIPYKSILYDSNKEVVVEPEEPDKSASVFALYLKKIPDGYRPDILY